MKPTRTQSLRFSNQEAAGKAAEILKRPLDSKGKKTKVLPSTVAVRFDPEASIRSGTPSYLVTWSIET